MLYRLLHTAIAHCNHSSCGFQQLGLRIAVASFADGHFGQTLQQRSCPSQAPVPKRLFFFLFRHLIPTIARNSSTSIDSYLRQRELYTGAHLPPPPLPPTTGAQRNDGHCDDDVDGSTVGHVLLGRSSSAHVQGRQARAALIRTGKSCRIKIEKNPSASNDPVGTFNIDVGFSPRFHRLTRRPDRLKYRLEFKLELRAPITNSAYVSEFKVFKRQSQTLGVEFYESTVREPSIPRTIRHPLLLTHPSSICRPEQFFNSCLNAETTFYQAWPYFLVLLALENGLRLWQNKSVVRLNDSITSMSHAVLQECAKYATNL